MRRRVSDRLVVAVFGLLAVSSLALKAAAGPPHDGLMDIGPGAFERLTSIRLRARHFVTTEQTFAHRSVLIAASRGSCRLGVRDARDGAAVATAFAADAADIGPVRYLYRGQSYDQPPAFAMRLGRIQSEVLSRLGMSPRVPMPVALAASPTCGDGDFGLSDVRI